LTASPSLWPGPRCASVSLGASAARTCELSIESPPRCAPSLWRFRPRDGRVPAADALCRALLQKDTRPACAAASSKDSVVDRPVRLASASSPRYSLSRGFEEHRRPMPAISTNHEHDRDLPNLASLFRGRPRCLQGCPWWLRRWVALSLARSLSRSLASPLTRLRQPSFPRSGALAGGAFEGLRWLRHPPARLLAPRLVTPTLVTRTPSVAGAWLDGLEEPISPDVFTSSYVPTRRARLRETRGQVPRFRKTSRQDGFL